MNRLQATYPSRKIGPVSGARGLVGPLAVDFAVEPQGAMLNWCWAAVTASVSRYYPTPPSKTMCEVATGELAPRLHVDCCASPGPCDVPWVLDLPLDHVGHFRARAGGWVQPTTVAAELTARNPMPIRVQWRNGGSHFLAIYGMQDLGGGAIMLWVTDPIFKTGSISHSALVGGGYQAAGGSWRDSYAVKP